MAGGLFPLRPHPTPIHRGPVTEALLGSLAFQHSVELTWCVPVYSTYLRLQVAPAPILPFPSFPAIFTCPPPALLFHLCLQHWQNYLCDSSRLTQRTLANVSIPLLYVATEALSTPSGNSWSVGSIWTGRTCPHPQASFPADIFHGSIRRRHSHNRKSRTDSRPVLIFPHFYHKSSRLVANSGKGAREI